MRIIQLFISFCLVILANTLSAQDLFELTYQFKNDTTKTIYKGLLVKNADGTGFLRLKVINKKTRKKGLYDFNISLNESDRKNLNAGALMLSDSAAGAYHYCWSKKYTTKEGAEIPDFSNLGFWFKENKKKRIAEPSLTTPFNVAGEYAGGSEEPVVSKYPTEPDPAGNMKQKFEGTGILSFKQLSNILFTKVYLGEFFTTSELFYEGSYTKKQILTIRNNTKPVIYLITVINSGDTDIAKNCIEDGKKVSGYFKRVAGFLDIPITEKKITGKDFNVTAVRAAVKNISPGKDDIVVFFYSGHGFRWKGEQDYPFPQMALFYDRAPSWDHQAAFSINLEDIFKEIKAKNARLNMVLGDLCNTVVNRRRTEIRDTTKSTIEQGYYDMNKETAVQLFLETNASMIISAAEKGQPANCSNGFDGFFTSSLLNSIRLRLKKTGPSQEWGNIIRDSGVETSALALKIAKEDQNIIYRLCNGKNNFSCVEDLGGKKAN